MIKSYVINLPRRTDRLEKFLHGYKVGGPSEELVIVKAVDGSNLNELEQEPYMSKFSENNDFGNNPRIKACAISHMKSWAMIANDGPDAIGLIFEDDIIFREDLKFKKLWPILRPNIIRSFKDSKNSIIYFGLGDVLPIHVSSTPSLHMLRAQEKAHATDHFYMNTADGINVGLGLTKDKSPYIFEWYGAFSYIINGSVAKYLLDLTDNRQFTKAIDVYLKDLCDNNVLKRLTTVPLLTYHGSYDLNIYDSDTTSIAIPQETKKTEISQEITFIITDTRSDILIDIIDSMYSKVSENWSVFTIVALSTEVSIEKTNDILDLINKYKTDNDMYSNVITVYKSSHKKDDVHEMFNDIIQSFCLKSDYVTIWPNNLMVNTENWSDILNSYKQLTKNNTVPAAFKFKSNNDTWFCSSFILNKPLVNHIKFAGPDIDGFLKYVTYLSKICILIRSITVTKLDSKFDLMDINVNDSLNLLKNDVIETINKITSDPNYIACGIWVNNPVGFNERSLCSMISELKLFDKGSF